MTPHDDGGLPPFTPSDSGAAAPLITETATPVRHLARSAPILSAEDTLGHACDAMREFNVGALAVAVEGRVIGLLREEDVLAPLSDNPEAARAVRVGEFAVGDPVTIPAGSSPRQALRALEWTHSPALPVVEEDGLYRGMISAGDLIAYWAREVKPPRIGGMATPFGVFLTGSGLRGGVGDRSLIVTGALLGVFTLILSLGMDFGLTWLDRATGWPLAAMAASTPSGFSTLADGVGIVARLLPFLALLGVIRLSPLAGYHAGEHQTVWAIERGETLTPEVVARMPRPHPRCGTNLITGLIIFETLRFASPELALIATVLLWRKLGFYVQLYLTTRPASRRQLESGIRAGKELLEKYRENPGAAAFQTPIQRVWNLGLLQGIIGWGVVMGLLSHFVGVSWAF